MHCKVRQPLGCLTARHPAQLETGKSQQKRAMLSDFCAAQTLLSASAQPVRTLVWNATLGGLKG